MGRGLKNTWLWQLKEKLRTLLRCLFDMMQHGQM